MLVLYVQGPVRAWLTNQRMNVSCDKEKSGKEIQEKETAMDRTRSGAAGSINIRASSTEG